MSRQRDELLDHDADGIREFDNDLPRWWLYGFYVTIAFAVVYFVNYHMLPTPLVGAKTVAEEYEADMAAHAPPGPAGEGATASGPAAAGLDGGGGPVPILAALTDEQSLAAGRKIYDSDTHPCRACHREDLGGLIGPDLTDDQWLHGCTPGALVQSIRVGYLTQGMLPYGGGPALSDAELLQVASYILSKHGSRPPGAKPPDPARDKPCE
jgi:cytochrome c oxidase cbb3-type subunit 3